MTKDEALEMAIEMLEKLSYEYGQLLDGDQDYGLLPSEINADIIKTYYVKRTCQEALEQPAMTYEDGFAHGYEAHRVEQENDKQESIVSLWGALTDEQPAQEPVAWMDSEGRFRLDFKTEIVRSIAAVNKEIPLYTHPAPSWQGLSDDEILEIDKSIDPEISIGIGKTLFARAIEQELKTKNGFSALKENNT